MERSPKERLTTSGLFYQILRIRRKNDLKIASKIEQFEKDHKDESEIITLTTPVISQDFIVVESKHRPATLNDPVVNEQGLYPLKANEANSQTVPVDFDWEQPVIILKGLVAWFKGIQAHTFIIFVLVILLAKERFVVRRSFPRVREENNYYDEAFGRMQQRIIELQASNDEHISQLALSALEGNAWLSLAFRCEQELQQLHVAHQQLEESIKESKRLVPVSLRAVSSLHGEQQPAHLAKNMSSYPGQDHLSSYNALVLASSKAVMAV